MISVPWGRSTSKSPVSLDKLAHPSYLVMLEWTMVNPDALETGCLGNLFIFWDSDVKERQHINKKLDLV